MSGGRCLSGPSSMGILGWFLWLREVSCGRETAASSDRIRSCLKLSRVHHHRRCGRSDRPANGMRAAAYRRCESRLRFERCPCRPAAHGGGLVRDERREVPTRSNGTPAAVPRLMCRTVRGTGGPGSGGDSGGLRGRHGDLQATERGREPAQPDYHHAGNRPPVGGDDGDE